MNNTIAIGLGNSLDKFFTKSPVPRAQTARLSGLRGEVLSVQVVYRSSRHDMLRLHSDGRAAQWTTIRRVDLAHVEHPTYGAPERDRIGAAPGFFPDPLIESDDYRAFPDQTRAAWVSVRLPQRGRAGRYPLVIRAELDGKTIARLRIEITVLPARLPPQDLEMIHWFHNDCLMSYYGFEAWSSRHWRMLKPYLDNAADHGVTTITTPLFTPPLDTAVGTERPTCQLVDVTVTSRNTYRFGYSRLGRWIDTARDCGLSGFELSHLSTQWGACFAPKIVATVNGRSRRIFGWNDRSDGDRYRRFLAQFLPSLQAFLDSRGVAGRCYLHVSDEPHTDHLSQYQAVRSILREAAPKMPVLEALSDLEFHEHGLVDVPCPSTDHAQPFLDADVSPLWCYYCCGQVEDVANRFMDFPSARNRILGWQLHKFGFQGFLHWGYNHWYDGLTDRLIDPYTNSHAGRPLPPGDGFVVYPGPDGPVDSIRWEVFREGLQDMRALGLLASLCGERPSPHEQQLLALPAIHSLRSYPRRAGWILDARDRVNAAIARRSRG